MKVAVLGGTGVAGSYAVAAMREAGKSVNVVSRSMGVDVYTGAGLEPALAGVDVVVDALNTVSLRRSVAEDFFVTAAGRILSAAEQQGVQHLVLLSIVGMERVRGYGYYVAKLAQERAIRAGNVDVTVLRATQFHEFPGQLLERLRLGRIALVPHARCQPVAARTVGRHLSRLVDERPGGVVQLAGPDVHDIADLTRRLVRARADRVRIIACNPPGRAARDMRGDALLPTGSTTIDGPSYDEWLGSPDARPAVATLPRLESARGSLRSQR